MPAPRYRTTFGMGLTCSDIYRINDVLVQYDSSGNPVVINNQNNDIRIPYFKCPTITNPTAGMTTSTNNTNITKKMRYAQNVRIATETKNVKKVYAVNNINRFGRWTGAPVQRPKRLILFTAYTFFTFFVSVATRIFCA
ncbi:hypothetical protein EBV26_14235 [bacterium]|nr:hypothetical protein [bacterium]